MYREHARLGGVSYIIRPVRCDAMPPPLTRPLFQIDRYVKHEYTRSTQHIYGSIGVKRVNYVREGRKTVGVVCFGHPSLNTELDGER